MRIVELSNHPSAMLDREQDRQAHAEREQQQAYEHAVAEHDAHVDLAREAREQARTTRSWWTWLHRTFALWGLKSQAPRRPPPVPADLREEAKLAAGMAGEQKVARHLGEALADGWTLICGYRNRGGEIDQLLVGPTGIIAIEVKHRNATVHCNGDSWRFEKFDRYGNHVGEGWITDRRGRSPSEQLRAPVHELEGFLSRQGEPIQITPVVLLTHPRSRLGSMQDLTVHVATNLDYVLELADAKPRALAAERCRALEQLIVRDHAFHEGQRRRRPTS
jgi:hypothetical protein